MDLVFTKTTNNMVQLQLWQPPFYSSAAPALYKTLTVPHDQAARVVNSLRPDIISDFNAWVAMNF